MSRRVKVIHICDKFGVKGSSIHGVSRLFAWWWPRFDPQRFDVRLVGLRPADAAVENLKREGIDVLSLGKGKFDLTTVAALVKVIRQERAEIVHLHGYGAANFGRMAARLTNAKTIVHEHFVDPAMPAYQKVFDRQLAGLTDFGIAVSKSVRDFMVHQRHIPANRVKVIYNGAPLAEFKPVGEQAARQERARWGIPEQATVIASIGRLDEQKGNRYLLEAARDVLNRFPEAVFLLVGDGPQMAELKSQAQASGFANRMIFTGFQTNIPLIQSVVDIQVFPSLFEGTPLTLFEAMSMGKAIVSTNVDGLGEVLQADRNALIVPPGDADCLAQAIANLLANPGKAQRLAQQASADSVQFDIEETVNAMEEVYTQLSIAIAQSFRILGGV